MSSLPLSLSIPAELFDIRVVTRTTAEVRSGPGAHFTLLDRPLKQGESVILFESVNVWCKIRSTFSEVRGWVHCQTLENSRVNTGFLTFSPKELPAVFAIQPIPVIYDYSKNERKIRVRIPKGSSFVLLKRRSGRKLVLLTRTLSVMWVDERVLE